MGHGFKRNMKDFYVYLSSVKTERHPENVFTDFTASLPHHIDLRNEKWNVGICDMSFHEKGTDFPHFLICCDLIQANFDSTSSLPILRFVHCKESGVNESFSNVYYCAVTKQLLDTIQIYIKSVGGDLSSVESTVFYCTLHFKSDG
jgi:hypothetical protein